MNKYNIILDTDSYKLSHHSQYPKKTTKIVSYFESRGGKFNQVVFFGLQYILKKYLSGVQVTRDKIIEAENISKIHVGSNGIFNKKGWEYILNEHSGKLPIEIKAVPEGTVVDVKNVLFTIENTDPKCYWLTNYLETLLVRVWYPMTVATNSREQKKIIYKYLNDTGNTDLVDFMLHDFGARGVSCKEQSAIGAGAHLTQFLGTDTLQGLLFLRDYYNDNNCIGKSVPASEHSTMTSWTKNRELDAYRNMLLTYPKGIVSIVIDSYNPVNAIKMFGTDLKELVMNRDGKTVLRPDSGYPPDTDLLLLNELEKYFPVRENNKGYKVLDNHIGLIQGDGIDYEMIEKILSKLKENGWSADNIVFGSGGGLLQKMNRDTQKCACKCSLAIINGQEIPVFKEPIMASDKNSKKGYTTLHLDANGNFETKYDGEHDFKTNLLKTVFLNGELVIDYNIDNIRKWSEINLE